MKLLNKTIWIYHASPHSLHSAHPEDCTNPHCVSYHSATSHTSISPSSFSSSPNFADLLSSSLRSIHSGHKPIIFPLYAVWCISSCEVRRYLLELCRSSCCLFRTSSHTKCVAQIAELGDTFQLHIGLNHNLFQQNWLNEAILTCQSPLAMEINICTSISCNATTSSMSPLATDIRQFTHKIELLPTPFLQTLGCPLESSASAMLTLNHIFVFPAFTLRLFFSIQGTDWSHF